MSRLVWWDTGSWASGLILQGSPAAGRALSALATPATLGDVCRPFPCWEVLGASGKVSELPGHQPLGLGGAEPAPPSPGRLPPPPAGVPGSQNKVFYECCREPYLDVTFAVTMRRRTLYYALNMLVPCLLLSAMTFLVFLLPADSGEKISLGEASFPFAGAPPGAVLQALRPTSPLWGLSSPLPHSQLCRDWAAAVVSSAPPREQGGGCARSRGGGPCCCRVRGIFS